ncbi:MAG: hypothetical protein M4579_001634 [Chaenotheca gracillima]|nr:MAG: hypothetical protein M4579_001634 [Chaenotheca gracillima]
MYSTIAVVSLFAILSATGKVSAGFDASSAQNVAVYWGQNSKGQSTGPDVQQNLAHYCASTDLDIIPMAFMTAFPGTGGQPEINFANIDDNCTLFDGTALLNCPQLADDIAACQNTYQKTLLLSAGGATYSGGGFTSESAATAAADLVWATFGPQQSGSSALRPFGAAAVDGFDLDFESTVTNMVPFANALRDHMDADQASTGKQWLLTAAPQCPYPDAADNDMLNGAVSFDAIWVQYYNNYCGVNSYVAGAATQNNFNFDTWDNWAKTVSKNPNVKVLLGVPASTTAGGGYEDADTLKGIIDYCKTFSSFGGVMMWDASQAFANGDFLSSVKSSLTTSTSRLMRRGLRAA